MGRGPLGRLAASVRGGTGKSSPHALSARVRKPGFRIHPLRPCSHSRSRPCHRHRRSSATFEPSLEPQGPEVALSVSRRRLQCFIHFLSSEGRERKAADALQMSGKPRLGAHRPWCRALSQFGGKGWAFSCPFCKRGDPGSGGRRGLGKGRPPDREAGAGLLARNSLPFLLGKADFCRGHLSLKALPLCTDIQ